MTLASGRTAICGRSTPAGALGLETIRAASTSAAAAPPYDSAFHGAVRDAAERRRERRGARIATGGVGVDGALDDAAEPARYVGANGVQRTAFAPLVRRSQAREITARDRVRAGQEKEQQDPNAVDVGLDRGLHRSGQHLGREVQGRTGQDRLGPVPLFAPGAEVHQRHPALSSHHHVLRFDVAVQKAGGMHSRDRPTECLSKRRDLRGREAPAILHHQLMKGAAVDIFHPQADAVVDPLGAINSDDAGVPDAGEKPAFFDDRCRKLVGGHRIDRQQLEGDLAIQPRVPRSIHVAERSLSDPFERRNGPHMSGIPALWAPAIAAIAFR